MHFPTLVHTEHNMTRTMITIVLCKGMLNKQYAEHIIFFCICMIQLYNMWFLKRVDHKTTNCVTAT